MYCYLLTNKKNKKGYVGITSQKPETRFAQHVASAGQNSHIVLQRAICKYGSESFSVKVVAEADTWEELQKLEKEMIVKYNTFVNGGHGYNMTFGADGGNTLLTEQARVAVSESSKKNMSNPVFLSRLYSPEVCARRTANMRKGLKRSWKDPVKRNAMLNNNKGIFKPGHEDSEETKARKSESMTGVKKTKEHRDNISKGLKGRERSASHSANISKALKGFVMAHCMLTHKTVRVTKQEFRSNPNLVGVNSRKIQSKMPIMSQALQACKEGAETRREATNLACNTPLASDISNRDGDIVHAL